MTGPNSAPASAKARLALPLPLYAEITARTSELLAAEGYLDSARYCADEADNAVKRIGLGETTEYL